MNTVNIDVFANRAARKYRPREQLGRILWSLCRPLFYLSPRPCFGWRRWLLRCFGARVGKGVHIYPSVRIYLPWELQIDDWSAIGDDALIYNLGRVRLGKSVTISYRAHVCAGSHDFSDPTLPLIRPPVTIEDQAWVGTDAFVGPGVTVGTRAIIGARAVVTQDVPQDWVVAGNPARQIGVRRQYSA